MPRQWFYLLTLISLTLLFVVFWDDSATDRFRDTAAQEDTPQQFPQAYLTGMQTHQYNHNGQLNYRFQAQRLELYEASQPSSTESSQPSPQTQRHDWADITQPNLELYNTAQTPWYLKADTGKALQSGDTIELEGDVVAWQIQPDDSRYELNSPALVVKPEQQFAQTEKPVRISNPYGITEATGMKANLKTKRIELLSNVRGTHVLQ